jgi:hypothetical protein
MATARQLGSALGVAIFVDEFGTRPARDLTGFDRAWIIVLITAAMTALAGLAIGRRLIRVRDTAETAGDASPTRSHRRRPEAQSVWR